MAGILSHNLPLENTEIVTTGGDKVAIVLGEANVGDVRRVANELLLALLRGGETEQRDLTSVIAGGDVSAVV